MAKTHTIKHVAEDFVIGASNQTWIFARSVDYATDGTAVSTGDTNSTTLVVQGHLYAGMYGIDSAGNNTVIKVVDHGEVRGAYAGIQLSGLNARIENDGTIQGIDNANAIDALGDDFTLHNTGKIVLRNSNGSAIHATGDNAEIINEKGGMISGDSGIYFEQGAQAVAKLTNHGTIRADDGNAITGGDGNLRITNNGTIDGQIVLGNGNGFIDTRGGILTHHLVYGNYGDDTLTTDNAKDQLMEFSDGGSDTVKSTVSYALLEGSFVENLVLLGSRNINGTGTTFNEIIHGNGGNNKIDGGDGYDDIYGGKGNDRLTGGGIHTNDYFFFKSGDGRDVIADFEHSYDDIYIGDWHGLSNFDEVLDHANFMGGNMTITAGKDSIVLLGIDQAHISSGDFNFGGL